MFSDVRSGAQRIVSLATHEQAAERTRMASETASVLAAAMEALSITAFVCDGTGVVQALTADAAALVRAGRGLSLTSDRLCASAAEESQALDDAIAAATLVRRGARPPVHRTIIVRGGHTEARPLVLEVVPLPRRDREPDSAPRVLVIARGTRVPHERRAVVVQAAYDLTSAETQIAVRLSAGESPEAIAAARRVAVGTVRAQIKAICAKLGVSRQAELVARLNDL